MNKRIIKLCIAAMLAAMICVATIIFVIPIPLGGYVNLGDCFILAGSWILGPVYGFAAAAVGSAMADVFSGFVMYAPATFIIKGMMAVVAALLAKKLKGAPHIVSAVAAEAVMVAGYYLTDAVFMGYGFAAAASGIAWNIVQGCVGGIIGCSMIAIVARTKALSKLDTYAIYKIT